ncbi:hypothetical protein BN874_520005 [Candidatus Contendobacter odensis Run_B_J11]|uniref:Uncharacterized protein n=1 Tax=Candidatus Contendobacter odensis Run_B_J11 TaxID=1400861 RepID=A0A7U7GE17_9GAMM|nr:hypothetical protein BN874_520005 [Candidatus Contendobacter odensis Run_B_J11]
MFYGTGKISPNSRRSIAACGADLGLQFSDLKNFLQHHPLPPSSRPNFFKKIALSIAQEAL